MSQAGSDVLDGGRGNDSITDWGDDYVIIPNTLRGGPGNDTITSEWGLDCITGGSGDDSVLAGFYNDRIDGGDGNDTLDGELNDDIIIGGNGDDTLIGGPEWHQDHDSLVGGSGNDLIEGFAGDDTLVGGPGSDTLDGGTGVDVFVSDALDTIIDAPSIVLNNGGLLDVSGTAADDVIHIVKTASAFQAVINGQVNDLSGLGVSQIRISGGSGNDSIQVDQSITLFVAIYGGTGNDTIIALGPGGSFLFGEPGNDTILGGEGSDCIDGGLGSDSLDGGGGDDRLSYWRRTDRLIKTDGARMTIRTSAGEVDTYNRFTSLICGDADDIIVINNPLDTIHYIDAKEGNDSLVGGPGNDTFYGEEGDDTLIGGGGNDVLEGGPGNNTIIYGPALRPNGATPRRLLRMCSRSRVSHPQNPRRPPDHRVPISFVRRFSRLTHLPVTPFPKWERKEKRPHEAHQSSAPSSIVRHPGRLVVGDCRTGVDDQPKLRHLDYQRSERCRDSGRRQ